MNISTDFATRLAAISGVLICSSMCCWAPSCLSRGLRIHQPEQRSEIPSPSLHVDATSYVYSLSLVRLCQYKDKKRRYSWR